MNIPLGPGGYTCNHVLKRRSMLLIYLLETELAVLINNILLNLLHMTEYATIYHNSQICLTRLQWVKRNLYMFVFLLILKLF